MWSLPTTAASSFETLPPPPPPPQPAASRTSGSPSRRTKRRLMSRCRGAAASPPIRRFEPGRVGDLRRSRALAYERVVEELGPHRPTYIGLGQTGPAQMLPIAIFVPAEGRLLQAAQARPDPGRRNHHARLLGLDLQPGPIDEQQDGSVLHLPVLRRVLSRERPPARGVGASGPSELRVEGGTRDRPVADDRDRPGGDRLGAVTAAARENRDDDERRESSHAACSDATRASTSPSASRKSSCR